MSLPARPGGPRATGPAARVGPRLLTGILCLWVGCSPGPAERQPPGPWELHYRDGIAAQDQGRYAAADSALNLALAAAAVFPQRDPRLHSTLRHLAAIGVIRGQTARAESLYCQLLEIQEKHLGAEAHPTLATLSELAGLHYARGELAQAESLYTHLLAVQERQLEQGDLSISTTLGRVAELSRGRGDYVRADALQKRQFGLKLYEQGYAYFVEGKLERAEEYYRRALAVQERHQGPTHPDLYRTCIDLARLSEMRREWEPAEGFYRRALDIQERAHGVQHPALRPTLTDLAGLLEKAGRPAAAAPLRDRLRAMGEGAPAPQ